MYKTMIMCVTCSLGTLLAWGQDSAPAGNGHEDLNKQAQNPLSSMA